MACISGSSLLHPGHLRDASSYIFSQPSRNRKQNTIAIIPRKNIAGSQIARFISHVSLHRPSSTQNERQSRNKNPTGRRLFALRLLGPWELPIQFKVQFQDINSRLAQESQLATNWRNAYSLIPRALATRGSWKAAAAGVISESRPEAEAVTRSMGTGVPGFSACAVVTSPFTRSTSF